MEYLSINDLGRTIVVYKFYELTLKSRRKMV